jgi:hypothetical protein
MVTKVRGTGWLFLLLEFIVSKCLRIIYKWPQFWNPIYTAIIQIHSISGYCDDRCTLWLQVSTSNQPFSSQLRILSVLYLSTMNVKYYESTFTLQFLRETVYHNYKFLKLVSLNNSVRRLLTRIITTNC